MNKVDINKLNEVLNKVIVKDEMCGYEVSVKLNEVIKEMKIGIKNIRGQMIYNYMIKGYIMKNKNGLINKVEVVRWFIKYISKKNLDI